MIQRRRLLQISSAFILAPATGVAQDAFPQKPIRIVVPFGPGGLADITMRLVGEKLAEKLGKPIVIVNQPGAGGISAAMTVLSAPSDGYTLAMFTNGTAISATLVRNLGFDPIADFLPISGLARFGFVVATASEQPYRSLNDLIAAARNAPGKLNIGTINPGSTQHLAATLFKSLAGIDMTIVPFRSTPEVAAAVLRRDIDAMVDGYSGITQMIRAGQIRPLATTGSGRAPYLPDTQTAIEAGLADFEVTSWNALFGPSGMPHAVIARLSIALREILADQDLGRRLVELGIEADWSPPKETGERLSKDIRRWATVIERAGIERQ